MKKYIVKNWFGWIFAVAILTRLAMTPWVYHGDIITQAGWGQWIFDHGMRGFYENNVWIYGWPNQPPIISWIYGQCFHLYDSLYTAMIVSGNFIARHRLGASYIPWFYEFQDWWGNAKYIDTPFKIGALMTMKIPSVIADAVLAFIVYKLVGKVGAIIYLLSPFVWYDSAIWGQHDQLGFIFLLMVFWFISNKKYIWLSPIMMAISILIKPTAFIFGPLLLWFAIRDKKTMKQIVIGSGITLIGYFILVRLISTFDFVTFNIYLQRQMFAKGEYWTWVNTFNGWRIITSYLTDYRQLFLGINLRIWGFITFIIINFWAFKICKKRDWDSALKAIFVIGCGGWMVMTAMHERYLFAAIVVGLILAMKNKKLFKYWIPLSLIFWINMYNGWWYPENFTWLKFALTWGNNMDGILPKLLAFTNLILMVMMIKTITKEKKQKIYGKN
ncbi:MAG: hypothetical protein WC069_03935 [Candidatus Shapirobacteria bacterium]